MSYVPVAEAAKIIRTKLKAMGYGAKHVSVRSDSYSMGSAIRVSVKDCTIPLAKVREVAKLQEDVRYDESSGEILSGGNRFVTVEYDRDAMKLASAPVVAQLPTEDKASAKVLGFTVIKDGPYFVILAHRQHNVWGAEHTAATLIELAHAA